MCACFPGAVVYDASVSHLERPASGPGPTVTPMPISIVLANAQKNFSSAVMLAISSGMGGGGYMEELTAFSAQYPSSANSTSGRVCTAVGNPKKGLLLRRSTCSRLK